MGRGEHRSGRAAVQMGRAEEFTIEPLWVIVAVPASILLWCAGPWVGGLLLVAALVWLRHRFS